MGHLVMDSDRWKELVRLELGPRPGIFSGERESIAEALLATCSNADMDDLLAACESRERGVRAVALRLFLYMAMRQDARLTDVVRERLALTAAVLATEGYSRRPVPFRSGTSWIGPRRRRSRTSGWRSSRASSRTPGCYVGTTWEHQGSIP
jgi:hypothetical protein